MKTYNFSRGILLKSIVGLLGLVSVSCGTYQNKSYYDNDGIYGGQRQETQASSEVKDGNVSEANQKYKEYFGSNANNYSDDQSESFTDVENYSSANAQNQDEGSDSNYGAWGTNSENVTINVYDNSWGGYNSGYWGNYWGYRPWRTGIYLGWNSWNYGWSNPYWGYSGYYGPSWGWYNPYYYGGYYGYNNYWNNGYYHGNDYVYNRGRRGSAYDGNRYSSQNNSMINNTPRPRSSSFSPRNNEGFQNPRPTQPPRRRDIRPETSSENTFYNTPRPRPNTEPVKTRGESVPRTRESSSPPRLNPSNNTPRPRSESSSPRSSYESPRSSSSSGSNSGSFSGGGTRSGGRRG